MTPLLAPSTADAFGLEVLAPEFELVEGGRALLMLTGDGNLFDLQQGAYLEGKPPLGIESFTYSDGMLVVIRNNHLGWYANGEIVERIALPSPGMKVVAGQGDHLYLYGPNEAGSMVYLLEGNGIVPLLEIPDGRISAFTAIGERIFFSIDNAIYSATKGEQAGIVFVAPGVEQIQSLAADTVSGLLYFSAPNSVYATRAGFAFTILRGLEGTLQYSNNALYVLDPKQRRLLKILGLEQIVLGESSSAISPGDFKE